MKLLTRRIVLCVCLAIAALPFTATPAAASEHCTDDDTSKAYLAQDLPLCPDKLVGKFFDSDLGSIISKLSSILGALIAVFMVGKAIMEAAQGGAGLSRAIGPIVMSLVVAALMFNIELVALAIARLADGVGSGASAILPFM